MEVDDRSAEGHAALGDVFAQGYWRWSDAEREMRRALTLDPDLADAGGNASPGDWGTRRTQTHGRGQGGGETDRALTAIEEAVELRAPSARSVVRFPSVRKVLGAEPRYQALVAGMGLR